MEELALKRCIKWLKGTAKSYYSINAVTEEENGKLVLWTDSNWAAPRSTSGWKILWGGTTLQTASRTQATSALSSAEAEIIAANEGAEEAVFLQNVLQELEGRSIVIELRCDASACVAFCRRIGVGRVRHLELRPLWVRDQIKAGKVADHGLSLV